MVARTAPVLALLIVGCSGPVSIEESVAETTLALNGCDESVPTELIVDGIPAYAQCESVSGSSIWSNNGVDTSTSSLGDDWVRTQWGGGYQCTELAFRYMYFRFGVDYMGGDAKEWCDNDLPSTLVKAPTPSHGDLIVFDGGACGADETTGHIAVIDVVDMAEGTVTFIEQNRAGRRSADQTCGSCFLHAVANDGSNAGAGGNGAGGGGRAGAETGGAETGGAAGGSMDESGGAAPEGGRSSAFGDAGSPAAGRDASGGAAGALTGAPGAAGGSTTLGAGGMPPGASASGGSSAVVGALEPMPRGNGGAPPSMAGGAGTTSTAGQGQIAPSVLQDVQPPLATGCGVADHAGRERTGSAFALLALFAAVGRRRFNRSATT